MLLFFLVWNLDITPVSWWQHHTKRRLKQEQAETALMIRGRLTHVKLYISAVLGNKTIIYNRWCNVSDSWVRSSTKVTNKGVRNENWAENILKVWNLVRSLFPYRLVHGPVLFVFFSNNPESNVCPQFKPIQDISACSGDSLPGFVPGGCPEISTTQESVFHLFQSNQQATNKKGNIDWYKHIDLNTHTPFAGLIQSSQWNHSFPLPSPCTD